VRALIVQIGFYCHALGRYSLPIFSSVLKSLFILNFDIFTSGFLGIELRRNLVFSIFFMCIYSVVIALFKDIPDVMGDAQEGIQTLSVRFGVRLFILSNIN
jgi:homogentisate phytyltransferase/homogentisate geranylgeranyltransferase